MLRSNVRLKHILGDTYSHSQNEATKKYWPIVPHKAFA